MSEQAKTQPERCPHCKTLRDKDGNCACDTDQHTRPEQSASTSVTEPAVQAKTHPEAALSEQGKANLYRSIDRVRKALQPEAALTNVMDLRVNCPPIEEAQAEPMIGEYVEGPRPDSGIEERAREQYKRERNLAIGDELWNYPSTMDRAEICRFATQVALSERNRVVREQLAMIDALMPECCPGCKTGEDIVMHQDSEWHDDGCGNPWEPCQAWPLRELKSKMQVAYADAFKEVNNA